MNETINTGLDPEIIVAIIGLISTVLSIVLTNLLTKRKHHERRQPLSDGRIKISRHDLFRRMDYWLNYLDTSFQLDDTGKSAVFKEMLVQKFTIWREELFKLAIDVENCMDNCDKDTCVDLAKKNMDAFIRAHQRTIHFYETNPKYNPDEREALKRVAAKFNEWHKHRIEYMEKEIDRKSNSQMHSDCYVRQVAIFDSYVGAFADTIFDAENSLNVLNGDLNGLIFNGMIIDSHRGA